MKLAYKLARWSAQLAASSFNQQSWSRAYCYAELAVFFPFLAVGVTIASTHFAYPRSDAQAELA